MLFWFFLYFFLPADSFSFGMEGIFRHITVLITAVIMWASYLTSSLLIIYLVLRPKDTRKQQIWLQPLTHMKPNSFTYWKPHTHASEMLLHTQGKQSHKQLKNHMHTYEKSSHEGCWKDFTHNKVLIQYTQFKCSHVVLWKPLHKLLPHVLHMSREPLIQSTSHKYFH